MQLWTGTLSSGPFSTLIRLREYSHRPQILRTEPATLPHRIGHLLGREVRGLLARSLSMRLAHHLPLIQQTSGVNVTASLIRPPSLELVRVSTYRANDARVQLC